MRKGRIYEYSSSSDEEYEVGLFHGWGSDNDERGTYTVAIVEKENGTVELVYPKRIKFIDCC